MKRPSETVSFRLSTDVAKLVDRAREPFGLSRGEWVRGLVINHLQHDETNQIASELVELRQSVLEVRSDSQSLQASIRRLAYALLTQGEPLSAQEAHEGVIKLFGRNNPKT